MSGLLRNLIAIVQALLARGTFTAQATITSGYWVTPFDTGIRRLKSDKYLQLAESAQLDFLIKTKLFGKLVRAGISFVNASQLVKFSQPIRLFEHVRVETEIVYADERCAYFSHCMFVGDRPCGVVLVKMKFKKGAITVRPADIIGPLSKVRPPSIEAWEQTLTAMS